MFSIPANDKGRRVLSLARHVAALFRVTPDDGRPSELAAFIAHVETYGAVADDARDTRPLDLHELGDWMEQRGIVADIRRESLLWPAALVEFRIQPRPGAGSTADHPLLCLTVDYRCSCETEAGHPAMTIIEPKSIEEIVGYIADHCVDCAVAGSLRHQQPGGQS